MSAVGRGSERSGPRPGALLGRDRERREITELLRAAASGAGGGALVIAGLTGSGRTALLDGAPRWLTGDRGPGPAEVLWLTGRGVAAESAVPGAGLQRVLRPLAEQARDLPSPLRKALRGALGRRSGPPPDRLVLGTAVLELLARAARDRTVLCRVDDADRLDPLSLETLAFAARRCVRRVVVLLATTATAPHVDPVDDVPALWLEPLDPVSARRLVTDAVTARTGRQPAAHVVDAVLELGHGNPLALTEIAAELSPGQAGGGEPPPTGLPVTGRLYRRYREVIEAQPPQLRRLLLLTAAQEAVPDGSGDGVRRGLDGAGVSREALHAAAAAGLVRLDGGRVQVTDPMLRDVLYRDADPADRGSAHRLLADALDPDRHRPDRAWHRAAVADGPGDPESARIAADLRAVGVEAADREDHATSARFLHRAADLTSAGSDAGRLLASAGRAAWLAGERGRANALLVRARGSAASGTTRGLVELMIEETSRRGDGPAPAPAPVRMPPADIAELAGDPRRLLAAARGADVVRGPVTGTEAELLIDHLGGLTSAARGDHLAAAAPLRRVVALAPRCPGSAGLMLGQVAATVLGDLQLAGDLAAEAVARARRGPQPGQLGAALGALALAEFCTGHAGRAAEHAAEGLRLARHERSPDAEAGHLALLALCGTGHDGRADVDRAVAAARSAAGRGAARPGLITGWARARQAIADGAADEAAAVLFELRARHARGTDLTLRLLATPDLVEAAVIGGSGRAWAVPATADFVRWAAGVEPVARAIGHRCLALLESDPATAEQRLLDSLALHGDRLPFERARTQLILGAALRRRRRPAAAREPLREALEVFEWVGATPWARRARAELRAAGGPSTGGRATAPGTDRGPGPAAASGAAAPADVTSIARTGADRARPQPSSPPELTAQQWQIVRMVVQGATNREIAAQLFLSPRTVDHHLRNVFVRLGIRSRVELARLVS